MDVTSTKFDYALVGGGLQSGLIALALRRLQPQARIVLVEREQHLGGNHTWCFHADDLSAEASTIVAPLVVQRWNGYRVMFPRHHRDLDAAYAAVTSRRFDKVVRAAVATERHSAVLLGAEAIDVGAHHVELADGRRLTATIVVDARGPQREIAADARAGYQKFVGLEVRAPNHGVTRPWLMDAKVEQLDGFRFVYVLPFGPDRLLIEDTRFSDTPHLDVDELSSAVLHYAGERGFAIDAVLRREQGVLPLPWQGDIAAPGTDEPIVGGYRGGWFHPVTGYSFPVAMRLAMFVAATRPADARGPALAAVTAAQRRQLSFCYRLNKMLFTWFAPSKRFNVLERFYTLPEPIIRRFYALRLGRMDRARILLGRPPRGMSYRAALFGRSPA